MQEQIEARVKRGWAYPLGAVPERFRSKRPKGAIRLTATGNTGAKLTHFKELVKLMIKHDATVPERANSAGTGDLTTLNLFALFILMFCNT